MSPLISQTRKLRWREVDKFAQEHTVDMDRVRIQTQVFYQRPHRQVFVADTVMNRSEELPAVTVYK